MAYLHKMTYTFQYDVNYDVIDHIGHILDVYGQNSAWAVFNFIEYI